MYEYYRECVQHLLRRFVTNNQLINSQLLLLSRQRVLTCINHLRHGFVCRLKKILIECIDFVDTFLIKCILLL